ncbi:MAG TPA: endonuclease domain-containing protein [Rhodothermales bacterium]|nr:endonuclease domain-containing protein [Rhodothermales bacterium]
MADPSRFPNNRSPQTAFRKQLRTHTTSAEAVLWMRLKARQMNGLRWRRQFGVGPYVLDFYCVKARLGIELDGQVHDDRARHAYDTERSRNLEAEGIAILRFENRQVFEMPGAIIDAIAEAAAARMG